MALHKPQVAFHPPDLTYDRRSEPVQFVVRVLPLLQKMKGVDGGEGQNDKYDVQLILASGQGASRTFTETTSMQRAEV